MVVVILAGADYLIANVTYMVAREVLAFADFVGAYFTYVVTVFVLVYAEVGVANITVPV